MRRAIPVNDCSASIALRHRHSRVPGGRDRGQRVLHVVRADQRPARPCHATCRLRAPRSARSRRRRRRRARSTTRCELQRRRAESFGRRPAAHRQSGLEPRIRRIPDDAAGAGNDAHEMMELPLDRGHVGVDVGVVELEVVEDRGARAVVDELGALVEERRVVLVRLDDEERRAARGARWLSKFAGTPPMRNPGDEPGMLQDPRQDATRWSSCRACRRPPAPSDPAAPRAPATPGPRHTECRSRAALRSPAGRASSRCRRPRHPASSSAAPLRTLRHLDPSASSCVLIGG